MSIQKSKRTSSRTRSVPRNCCDDQCPAGSRNNYFLGKHLTPDSYKLEQDYAIERRRLLNRAIHGWGVAYGFALADGAGERGCGVEPGELRVGEGLALDELGRELIQVGSTVLTLDNLLVLDDSGKPVWVDGCDLDDRIRGLGPDVEDCWLLSAHYAEQTIGPVTLKDPCCDDRTGWDQTCETIVYSLQRIPCGQCCEPQRCGLECDCSPDSPCCAERKRDWKDYVGKRREVMAGYEQRLEALPDDEPVGIARLQAEYEKSFDALAQLRIEIERKDHPRGGCACLCEHLTKLELGHDCARPAEVGDCTHADLDHGVKLACLRLAQDACGDWTIGAVVDACGPRRLVKRNDLLFDLINGCDVTRIVEVGWAAWHRRQQPIPFNAFAGALGWDAADEYGNYPTTDFWVRFSRPVRTDTLTPEVFAMAAMTDQAEGGWLEYYRVPILAVESVPPEPEDGLTDKARIVVSGPWMRDGVMGERSIFREGETRIEIEVRGDLIEDCLGQTVDANPRGWSPVPTGTDGPGDSYLSAFTVATRIPDPRQPRPPVNRRRPTAAA
jgi:hypothetical protein